MNDSVIQASAPSIAVVIATRNRPEPLRTCLSSMCLQSIMPGRVIIVDSSEGSATAEVIEQVRAKLNAAIDYEPTCLASAARQRNLGAQKTSAEVVLFLDDDVVLESTFLAEVAHIFRLDTAGEVGGVSGTISNQVYMDPRGLNRFLLGACLGRWTGSYAGKLLGPAVNFLPADTPDTVQEVEWLPSTCTAYRRDVFLSYRFCDDFEGYSFAEDVHLSARVHKTHRLLNTSRGRVFHHDLGKSTHKDWKALGESQVVNRRAIMVDILGRNRVLDHVRLFGYEIVYTTIAWLAGGVSSARLSTLAKLMRGKFSGFAKIWSGRTRLPKAQGKSVGSRGGV